MPKTRLILGSIDNSYKNNEIHISGRYMNEDIELMSKEIEQIRDQILNASPITPVKLPSASTPSKSNRKNSYQKRLIVPKSASSNHDGYIEDSE